MTASLSYCPICLPPTANMDYVLKLFITSVRVYKMHNIVNFHSRVVVNAFTYRSIAFDAHLFDGL